MSVTAIVQTAFIGDVVLATPLFEAARKSRPRDTIIAVVRAGCENLPGNNPFVDEVVVWDKRGRESGIGGFIRFVKRLRSFAIDTAIIPHRSLRTAAALFHAGVRTRIGFAKGGGMLLHTIRVPYCPGIHEVERNLMLAEAVGWETAGCLPAVFPDDHDRSAVDDRLGAVSSLCVLAPGSVWMTKRWPVEYYSAVGNAFAAKGMRVVVSGGEGDKEICAILSRNVSGAIDTCGLLSLRQSAELYRRAAFVLTGDSAPQHIAAAMGTGVFSIFGPTVRDFGFWPYTERGMVIEEDADCRPCGVHGHRECPDKSHRCMKSVTPERVIRLIEETLGS
ncbi:glycosyltransferase family 9 protein [bacterium]|nr:glycosyltransferase family 9 protein [bacterium]